MVERTKPNQLLILLAAVVDARKEAYASQGALQVEWVQPLITTWGPAQHEAAKALAVTCVIHDL